MPQTKRAMTQARKKMPVKQARRLVIKLRRQRKVTAAFGKYRWEGDLEQSRKSRIG
jgi:hypothetical protein